MNYLKEVWASRELLFNLTMREVRGKYKRTVFGQLWSLANPLALMLIYTFVFGIIFRSRPDPGDPSGIDVYALWLLCALLPWTFFANVVSLGLGSLVTNANLIQKVYFNRIVLPLSAVGSTGYNWLFEMAVLLIALSFVGGFVVPWIPLLLVIMVLLAMFAAGIAFMLAVANVYFRDTQYFLTIVLQMWMYLTPIIYPVSLVKTESDKHGGLFGTPITILDLFHLNPMEHFVNVFRQLIYDNRWPDGSEWLICACWAVASLVIGLVVFRRNERNLAEML
ncbi:ABC transporter permease [Parafrigoribacterium humi]|jgi:ABC-2 type transport system permease protein|uniref:ABC transporter permease n=1 Tax=Parafrigoribacterium humi TaxID=3144664 RepID=UPI0032EA90C2